MALVSITLRHTGIETLSLEVALPKFQSDAQNTVQNKHNIVVLCILYDLWCMTRLSN